MAPAAQYSSPLPRIAFYGFAQPAIAALLALLWIVATDAKSLRKHIEDHAKHLNTLDKKASHRERIAHKPYEIIGGITEMKLHKFEEFKRREWEGIQNKLFDKSDKLS